MNDAVGYGQHVLDDRVRSRIIEGVNGLDVHLLEAGFEDDSRPLVLLLHGFPEIAFSWRHQLVALADAGYHVVAPDQRGYGLTRGWDARFDGDVATFRMFNLVADTMALVSALGRAHVELLVGHDFGSPLAAWCALIRPDVFRRLVLMSAPFGGAPPMARLNRGARRSNSLMTRLAELEPPRKHYQWYFSEARAAQDLQDPPQGLHRFLREYYHLKSADWPGNEPRLLAGWTPDELAKLPEYYVMRADATMPETTANMVNGSALDAPAWLDDDVLGVYVDAYRISGFQGGLNWYRCVTNPALSSDMRVFAGRTIDVPCTFVAGAADWGVYQSPGQYERMQNEVCGDFRGSRLLEGAGHWVQQERPGAVNELLLECLSV